MDNLEEMYKFLERYNLPRVNQEEIENMNRKITSTEMETVIKNLPTNKSPGPDGFTGEFHQTFRWSLAAKNWHACAQVKVQISPTVSLAMP